MAQLARSTQLRRPASGIPGRFCLRPILAALTMTLLTATATVATAAHPLITGANGPSEWLHDYGQGRELSRELGLPLIVHFHASWCGPCQQMERETLSSRQLLSQFGREVVGVKIDSDAEPGLVEAFRIDALPCDVVIAPDGLIVERKSGYQPRSQYLAMVTRMNRQFQQERTEAIARLQPTAPTQPATQPATRPDNLNPGLPPQQNVPDSRNLAATPLQNSDRQASPGRPAAMPEQPTVRQPVPQSPTSQPPAEAVASSSPLVGLDGYCPVHIKSHRQWIKGNPAYATTWQGVVYHFASAEDLRMFESAPQTYAPRMLGCDPVQLWMKERAVQGSVEYGAFFNGDLFLFVSSASRDQFKVNPNRYVQLRHAFRADDVIGTRLR